jgi:DNA repair protein RadD
VARADRDSGHQWRSGTAGALETLTRNAKPPLGCNPGGGGLLARTTAVTILQLRSYQRAAVDAIPEYFRHHDGNPLIEIPTAGGKSLVMAAFIQEVLAQYPDERIIIVTHVRELIAQNYHELLRLWPGAPAGIYSAGLNRRDTQAQILLCGIQSVHKRAYDLQRCDLLLIDEAHLVPRSGNTMYRRFIDDLRVINPKLKIIGFTATPFRLDSGLLHEGDDALFTDIAYAVSIRDLIIPGLLNAADRQAHGHATGRLGRRHARRRVHRRRARACGR